MRVVFGEAVWNDLVRVIAQASKWLQSKASLLLVLPIAHLSICSVYLAVYFYLFGNNLSMFANAGDVFSVSFTDIAPFYAMVLYAILLRGYDFENTEKVGSPPKYFLRAVMAIEVSILIYIVAVIISEYNRSGYIVIELVWVCVFLVSVLILDLQFKDRTKGQRDIFLVVMLLGPAIFLSAAGHAQRDRFHDYQELIKNSPTCGSYAIVNRLGDQYLVVRNDNSRWLSDESCKLGAKVATPPVRTYPLHWKINFWPF